MRTLKYRLFTTILMASLAIVLSSCGSSDTSSSKTATTTRSAAFKVATAQSCSHHYSAERSKRAARFDCKDPNDAHCTDNPSFKPPALSVPVYLRPGRQVGTLQGALSRDSDCRKVGWPLFYHSTNAHLKVTLTVVRGGTLPNRAVFTTNGGTMDKNDYGNILPVLGRHGCLTFEARVSDGPTAKTMPYCSGL